MNKSIFLLLVLLIIPVVYSQVQWQTQIQSMCSGNVCLEGNPAVWRLQIANIGNEPITFQQIALVDDMGLVFANRIFKENEFTLKPGLAQIVDVQGVVPAATKGSLVYFTINYVINGKTYNDNIRANKIMPLSEVECLSHDYCSQDKLCVGYRCVPESLVNATNITRHVEKQESSFGFTETMLVLVVVLLILISFQLSKKK